MTPLIKFRDGDLGPIVILSAICVIITLALVSVYQMTAPIIEMRKIEAANQMRREVMPHADDFSAIEGILLPDGVFEVHKTINGEGYVFLSGAKGFGGMVTFMIGIDRDGGITGISLFEHNETPGLGTKVGSRDYLTTYFGFADPNTVDGITGATRTTNALKNAITQVRKAFEIVKEGA